MKKLLPYVAMASMVGIASAQDVPAPREVLIDRVSGTYTLECRGFRTDTGQQEDWLLGKQNMDYLAYGVASHVVIDALNKFYADLGDKAIKQGNIGLPDGLPVPGVTR